MMYENKLSIIIPTKNRQKYAVDCIKTILSFDSDEYEIIVQDNSDNDSMLNMLAGTSTEKVKYFYCDETLSFCKNFQRALEHASGDYIIYIGDDDAVLPEIFEVIKIARENEIDAIRYFEGVTYKWPGAVKEGTGGELVIRDVRPYVRIIKTDKAVSKMIQKGNYDYQAYNFPFVYHGIVKRAVFDKVLENTGHYFGGLTPDIYAAVSLSYYIDHILYVNYPLSIPGICPKSGSADSLTGRHNGDLKNAPHFRGVNEYQWDKRIPYVYSVDTIWAETAMKAMDENSKVPEISPQNYYNYTVHLIANNPQAAEEYVQFYNSREGIKRQVKETEFNNQVKIFKAYRFARKGVYFCKSMLIGRHKYHDVSSIEEAVAITVDYFRRKRRFSKIMTMLKNREIG